MFRSISKSWKIAKESWLLLMEDKKLLVFPMISGTALLLVLASFGLPLFALGAFKGGFHFGAISYLMGFAFYFVSSLLIIFFNAALVGAINLRLQGHEPTLKDGLRCAWKHRLNIVGYAAVSATVGLLLRMLRERGGILARATSFFGGLAWAMATYVAIPVLVVEGYGPIKAIQKSSSLIKKTWGHQLAGHVGFGAFQGLVSLAIVIVTVPLVMLSLGTGLWPITVVLVAIATLAQIASTLIFSTMMTIYSTAVYRYATHGETSGFSPGLLQS